MPMMPTTVTTTMHHRPFSVHSNRKQAVLVTLKRMQASPSDDDTRTTTNEQDPMTNLIRLVGSTTSLLVGGSVFCAIVWYRNALTVSLFIGSVSNGILSKILKRLLRQERPITASVENATTSNDITIPNDHGMPSSHAMSLGFIGMFTAWQFPITAGPLVIYVAMSLYYRVCIKAYHTWEQIAVGLVLGSINGTLWWHWTTIVNSSLIGWISEHLLRDGLLPYSLLWVPLVVGGLTVSSFERKVSSLLGRNNNKKDVEKQDS
ncbi:dolichyldiphosphatase [Fistulifera solaris]|uniref:Dolichyldiphosphatase n=1 Tax=Fistulifera solaris TaxID=1519565 RepID=A0A1Z5K688_FISSO|nr:dolichyldiphosphatase [Fistulifera solaris]|eukprot:GAX21739.1 dolichyldiphosphatase [Fistulifera solaris]